MTKGVATSTHAATCGVKRRSKQCAPLVDESHRLACFLGGRKSSEMTSVDTETTRDPTPRKRGFSVLCEESSAGALHDAQEHCKLGTPDDEKLEEPQVEAKTCGSLDKVEATFSKAVEGSAIYGKLMSWSHVRTWPSSKVCWKRHRRLRWP